MWWAVGERWLDLLVAQSHGCAKLRDACRGTNLQDGTHAGLLDDRETHGKGRELSSDGAGRLGLLSPDTAGEGGGGPGNGGLSELHCEVDVLSEATARYKIAAAAGSCMLVKDS